MKHSIFNSNGRVGCGTYGILMFVAGVCLFLPMGLLALSSGDGKEVTDFVKIALGVWYYFDLHILVCCIAKRSHDLGHSGWWAWNPFYRLSRDSLLFNQDGAEHENRYGSKGNGISHESIKLAGSIAVILLLVLVVLTLAMNPYKV